MISNPMTETVPLLFPTLTAIRQVNRLCFGTLPTTLPIYPETTGVSGSRSVSSRTSSIYSELPDVFSVH